MSNPFSTAKSHNVKFCLCVAEDSHGNFAYDTSKDRQPDEVIRIEGLKDKFGNRIHYEGTVKDFAFWAVANELPKWRIGSENLDFEWDEYA